MPKPTGDAARGREAVEAALLEAAGDLLAEVGPRAATVRDIAARAGVKHQVCISIVGCEQVPLPYYRVKVEQEKLARGSAVPVTVVRATQFHTLIADLFEGAAKYRLLPGGSARLQPSDPRPA